jgi:hypothetical protein
MPYLSTHNLTIVTHRYEISKTGNGNQKFNSWKSSIMFDGLIEMPVVNPLMIGKKVSESHFSLIFLRSTF